ncbi:MarP family serine protease [Bifidobacterium tibiigranuli]|jgi:S1-C subfamily serine protease|uniref:MarP family serine protease n=1 Tax=Bifidobacterium tibiigranuli TaxID=2172043 RepID=UPI002355F4AA|nr:MarP family serine protease [Bifidobacterium tibiigranuli]MCI1210495.1 MarP family serine protease [Bifidobacterium tibiigranuli]MCI1220993.1 MarP family serine protease [Bifidobacterium tibiigranuli]
MLLPIDIVLAILLISVFAAGIRAGFFSTLGTFVGLIAGAVAMPYVLPRVARSIPSDTWRGIAVFAVAIGLLALMSGIGSSIGHVVRRGADRLRLGGIERLLGGGLALVCTAVALSLTAAGVITSGIPVLSQSLASSQVIQGINRYTPQPVSDAVARLRAQAFDNTGIPTLKGLFEGDGNTGVNEGNSIIGGNSTPAIDANDPKVQAASQSVARISGIAPACSTMSSGSGFLMADDLLITNAHVVAGVTAPLVELPGEPARTGSVIYFDPVNDLAVVSADVNAKPLSLDDSTIANGSAGVVQGYPYGGPFQSVPARVLSTERDAVPDIYGDSTANRSLHVLQARVEPGNSGGPLLDQNGEVTGIVFAKAQERADIGYAMTNDEIQPVLSRVSVGNQPVSTGRCLAQ